MKYYVISAQALAENCKTTCEEFPDLMPITNENCTFAESSATANQQVFFVIVFIFILLKCGWF